MAKVVIISGYFNPAHVGHLDMIEAAKRAGDKVVVIVNNDAQQMLKKGKIINSEADRVRMVSALRDVDEVVLSIDQDPTIVKTLQKLFKDIKADDPEAQIVFGNGGSDRSKPEEIPEYDSCQEAGVEMIFDMGGNDKADSSTRINDALGVDPVNKS